MVCPVWSVRCKSPPGPPLLGAGTKGVLYCSGGTAKTMEKQVCKATSVGTGALLLPFQGLNFGICKAIFNSFLFSLCFLVSSL